jgi:hypothetical protein
VNSGKDRAKADEIPPTSAARRIDVFFYGLFMDEALLREKGVDPQDRRIAGIDGYSLRIGNRATLVPCAGHSVHGVLYALIHAEIDALYAEPSVSAYRPEAVAARAADGRLVPALCFNLPQAPSAAEANPQYAARLKDLARRIGLPASYVASIESNPNEPERR